MVPRKASADNEMSFALSKKTGRRKAQYESAHKSYGIDRPKDGKESLHVAHLLTYVNDGPLHTPREVWLIFQGHART